MEPRRYTKYTRHVNNSGEVIDAKHINQLQEDVNELQKLGYGFQSDRFHHRLNELFMQHDITNSLYEDHFYDSGTLNLNASKDIKHDPVRHCIYATGRIGHLFLNGIQLKKEESVNDFFLQTNTYCPVGTDINYYIRLKDGRRYEILSDQMTKALRLREPITEWFCLEIEFVQNHNGVSPEIYGYGLFYNDSEHNVINQFKNEQFQEPVGSYSTYEYADRVGRN